MDFRLEIEFSKAPILQEIDALKDQIDALRPLSPELERRVMQKLRLDWNYNSNAIEGNRLSYGETTALLMHGITAKGKPLKDHLDIKGHNTALEYLDTLVKEGRDFTEMDIRSLHEVILVEAYNSPAQTAEGLSTNKQIQIGKYKSSPNHVKTITGEIHYYTTPEETPAKMTDLMNWYKETENKLVHPVIIAALFHHKFVEIHPFDDGNGRMARILMNLVLMKNGYPPVIVKTDDRQNYYGLLSQADTGDNFPFVEYIAERLQSSLNLYIKGINGGDIDEDEDIDKEIALYRLELQSKIKSVEKVSIEKLNEVIRNVIFPFIKKLRDKLLVFDEFFEQTAFKITPSPDPFLKTSVNFEIEKSLEDDLFNHINKLIASNLKIGVLSIDFELRYFKKLENKFEVTYQFEVVFEDQAYLLTDINRLNVYKSYNERLTINDQNTIIKTVLQGIKEMINDHLKIKKAGN